MTIERIYAGAAVMAAALDGLALPACVPFAAAGKLEIDVTRNTTIDCASRVTVVPVEAGDARNTGLVEFDFSADCDAPFEHVLQFDNRDLLLVNVLAATRAVIDAACGSSSINRSATSRWFTDSGRNVVLRRRAKTQLSRNRALLQLLLAQYADRLRVFVSAQA